jgi:hypothetical protein
MDEKDNLLHKQLEKITSLTLDKKSTVEDNMKLE